MEEKEDAFEMEFMLETMRLKEFAAEGNNLARLLRREDNSAFPYAYEALVLPLDSEGFVQSFAVHETEGIRSFFQRYGLVVVRDAIDVGACDRSVQEVWDYLERQCKGLDRAEASTWEQWASLSKLGILGNNFFLSPQFCENRQAPGVHRAFAAVFGTERLVVNVGRASAMRPTHKVLLQRQRTEEGMPHSEELRADKPEWKTKDGAEWLHWDMNPFTGAASTFSWRARDPAANRSYERLRVQGILALSDCGPQDGGFFCVPGSHSAMRGWAQRHGQAVRDSKVTSPESNLQLVLPQDDPLKENAQKAPIRKGSLLIWSAALAHCNFPNNSDRLRVVQYIQMAEADDPVIGPLCTKLHYFPPTSQFSLTELGSKLYGFRTWD